MQRPTITPSDEEIALVAQILEHTQSDRTGFLATQAAFDVFNRSGLSRVELRDIWRLSDADSNGRFTQDELAVAIRLMGWMQSGRPFSESLLEKPGPLPTFEGIPGPSPKPPTKDPSLSQRSIFPPVSPTDVQESYQLFIGTSPIDGYLEGDKVRDVFLRFNLAYRDLSSIWVLLDTNSRGRLNFHEFAMGMYLIQALRSCHLIDIPTSIPTEVHRELEELTNSIIAEVQSPFLAPGEAPTITAAPRLQAPTPPVLPAKSLRLPPKPPPIKPNPTSKPWIVMPREKMESDRSFAELDVDGSGLISHASAAQFLQTYQLPEEELSQILDLSSVRRDTHLNSDEFSVAVHLAQGRLKGKEIPFELPSTLIPPSLRQRSTPLSSPLSSPQLPSPPPKPHFHHDLPVLRPPQISPTRRASLSRLPSRSMSTPQFHQPMPDESTPLNGQYTLPSSSVQSLPNALAEISLNSQATSPKPDLQRRRTSFISTSYILEEDPLEELKTETKSLRRQIDNLLGQLSAQNDLRQQNDKYRQENGELKAKMSDLETSIASVLTQMQNNDNALSEELTKEIERLSRRVAELEQTEHQLQQTVGILEVTKRDKAALTAQIRDLRHTEVVLKTEAGDARRAKEEVERENDDLKNRLADMTKAISEPDNANSAKQLRVLLKDITRENESLKTRVRETERSMEQLLLSSKNTTQNEELRRQNRELEMQVQELEQLTAQLQSSQEENHLQQLFLVVTRENEGMKVRLRELQTSTAQIRSEHDGRASEMQRRIDELVQENNRLKTELQDRTRRESMDVPPPAYDDNFNVPTDLR